MTILYSTHITGVGSYTSEALEDHMMILFDDNAPTDAADYCFIHPHAELSAEIKVGNVLVLDQEAYPVTAVGNVANQNLAALGHITLRFDGAENAEYPGTIHVQGQTPKALNVGAKIIFEESK
ncbi:PTS glucitol/sorbitol transporter subunit IIA [Zooshikella sp. RANM57]|uniref:PTS glucitol/sorbitol transporter subunit IIA n=1 Tax=Zooshikella sp. RANM57 TaxID=3425863 RepID=UPI003D6E703A